MSNNYKRVVLGGAAAQPRQLISNKLREVNGLLGKRKREDALRMLAEIAVLAETPTARAKVANLVAQSQFALGRYEDAITRYRRAAILGAEDGLDEQKYLGPSLGVIRCLLKNQKPDEAYIEARKLSNLAVSKQRAFDKKVSLSTSQLQQVKVLSVAARPVRPSVVLTRIGETFLQEGYLDAGKSFLEEVIIENPKGGSRARQFLAQACLLEGNASRAEQLARESLLWGEFKAKTILSWVVFIQARKLAGKPLLDPELFKQFQHSQIRGRVADRAEIIIISELRRQNDAVWLSLAKRWRDKGSGRDPIIRVEILKMILGEIKAGRLHADAPAPAAIAFAEEIMREPTITANESIGLAKTMGEFGVGASISDHERRKFLTEISIRFGSKTGARARHAHALGLYYSGQHELARKSFTELIADVKDDPESWGKAVWSVARLEASLNRYSEAAEQYLNFVGDPRIKSTLRLQAFLRWIRLAEKSGQHIDLIKTGAQLDSLVGSLEDYRPLLDAARQLSLAGPRFHSVFVRVSEAAQRRAVIFFDQATTTEEALKILLPVTRRLYYDFRLPDKIIDFHERLTEEKIGWLWSNDARFWEYLSLVMRSYLAAGPYNKGLELALSAKDDPGTPAVGRVYLAAHYGLWLNDVGRLSEALPFWAITLQAGPNHRLSAHAYYWTAIAYYVADKTEDAIEALLSSRRCLLPRPGLLSEWRVDAKAGLLLRRLVGDDAEVRLDLYKLDFLQAQERELDSDLLRVTRFI
jgi:tetratricopeptide (TPR) repeat protein